MGLIRRLLIMLAALGAPAAAHAQFATIQCWNGTKSFACGDLVSSSLRVKIIEAPTLTVSGTVTANQGGSWTVTANAGTNTSTAGLATAANQTTIIGHVDGIEGLLAGTLTVGTHAVTQSGNWTTLTERASASSNDGACVSVTGSTTVLASNSSRKGFTLYARETNTAVVHVKFAATATTSDFPLAAGSAYNMTAGVVYTGVIDAIAASGTQSVCVVEF